MTEAEFARWLKGTAGARPVVLVEMDYRYSSGFLTPTVDTIYLANKPYITNLVDPELPNRAYMDCVSSFPMFSKKLDLDAMGGRARHTIGDIELRDEDGRLNYLLDLIVDGAEVRIYYGDMAWEREHFRLMTTAVVAYIDAPNASTKRIALRDKILLLDKSIVGEPIGGSGPQAHAPKNICIGTYKNIDCTQQYSVTLLYWVATNQFAPPGYPVIPAMRSNGLPIDYLDNGNGSAFLLTNPFGRITADIVATNSLVSDVFEELVLDHANLDTAWFEGARVTFDVGGFGDVQVGLLIKDRTNIAELIDRVALAGNAFWGFSREGKFIYGRLMPKFLDSFSPVMSFTMNDVVDKGSMKVTRIPVSYGQIRGKFQYNDTAQPDGLAATVSAIDRARWSRQSMYDNYMPFVPDRGYLADPRPFHPTMTDSPDYEVPIQYVLDTDAIAAFDLWQVDRFHMVSPNLSVLEMQVGLGAYTLEIGDVVHVAVNKFGLDAGKKMQVVGTDPSILEQRTRLSLLYWTEPHYQPASYYA